MAEYTVQQLIRNHEKAFKPEVAEGVEAVIQYHLTGAEASDWAIAIKAGKCTVAQGTTTSPTMTFTADSQIYKDIASGKLNGMTAFMKGKVS